MRNTRNVLLVALLASVTLGACTRTVDRVEPAHPEGTPQYVEDHRVLTPTGPHHRIRTVAVRETTVSNGMLKIEVELENARQTTQRLLYGFEWFDADGMSIREPQWRTKVLLGRQRSTISDVAASPDAVDFRLHLRRAAR